MGLCIRLHSGDFGPEKSSDQAISRLPGLMSGPFAPGRGPEGGFPYLQGALLPIGSGASPGPQLHWGVHLPPSQPRVLNQPQAMNLVQDQRKHLWRNGDLGKHSPQVVPTSGLTPEAVVEYVWLELTICA